MTFCQSKGGIPYFETSAKEAVNVEEAFQGKYSTESDQVLGSLLVAHNWSTVIARNALAQEVSEEFNGDYPDDPINIQIENERDGCAC